MSSSNQGVAILDFSKPKGNGISEPRIAKGFQAVSRKVSAKNTIGGMPTPPPMSKEQQATFRQLTSGIDDSTAADSPAWCALSMRDAKRFAFKSQSATKPIVF